MKTNAKTTKHPRFDIIFLFTIFIALMTTYTIGTINFMRNDLPEVNDFRWFYSVGKAYRLNGPEHVYDIDLARKYQAQVADKTIGEERLLLPNHPPLVFPILAILSNLDFRPAYYWYIGISLFLTAPALAVVFISLRRIGWNLGNSLIAIIGLILFEPFYVSLMKGQDTYLLYSGGFFLLTGWILKKDWLSGFGLGLTVVRPQIALLLALPFFFQRRKIWWWFFITALIMVLYSVLQVGWQGVKDYLDVLFLSTGVEEHGWDEIGMLNLVGILIRVFPQLDLDIIHAIGWSFYGISMIGLCVLWKLSKTISYWHLSLAVGLSLFSAPHLHYHDLALLAVPILGLMIVLYPRISEKKLLIVGLTLMAALVMVFSELLVPVLHTIPYLLMGGLPYLTFQLEKSTRIIEVKD